MLGSYIVAHLVADSGAIGSMRHSFYVFVYGFGKVILGGREAAKSDQTWMCAGLFIDLGPSWSQK